MLAINYNDLKENMNSYMDKITDEYEAIIVTRSNNKNVVMISKEAYSNLLENAYITSSKANFDWLMESKKQLEEGKLVKKELIEVLDE